MTLIEISLVIALLLGLVAVLFIGLGSYRKGADKAKCKSQIVAVQKVVRAQANFKGLDEGTAFAATDVFGASQPIGNAPTCPAGGIYSWFGTIPPTGTAYGACDFTDDEGAITHALTATETKSW
jgi:hypothetical protein